jgi:hypothetical protein
MKDGICQCAEPGHVFIKEKMQCLDSLKISGEQSFSIYQDYQIFAVHFEQLLFFTMSDNQTRMLPELPEKFN